MMSAMQWSLFDNKKGVSISPQLCDWRTFVEHLHDVGTYAKKDDCPLVKLAIFGQSRSSNNSLRHNSNVSAITGIEGDYDAEIVQPEQAIEMLEAHNLKAVICTTTTSTKDRPRWRVFMPLSEQCDPSERYNFVARLNGALGGILAGESFTLSQSYFVGKLSDSEYKVLVTFDNPDDGYYIDEQVDLDEIAIGRRIITQDESGNQRAIEQDIFADEVRANGGSLLRTGDTRRDLLKSYIASRSSRGVSSADILLQVRGISATYFAQDDPIDEQNIVEIIESFSKKDYKSPVDISGLLAKIDRIYSDDDAELSKAELPAFCDELINLPYSLGAIQDYIYGSMKYPSRATAAITAIAAFSTYAMQHFTVKSYGGLALNEYYMMLAPTSSGKEDLRKSIKALFERAHAMSEGNLCALSSVEIQYSAPASQQALHMILESNKNQLFMADEFGEWLAETHNDSHKQGTLGYLMQIYTSALGTVCPPKSKMSNYQNVHQPRVSIFSTSTAERMLEAMTKSQSDSGAYGRWILFPAEQERIEKVYEGLRYEPSSNATDALVWINSHTVDTSIEFSSEAWEFFKHHDSKVIEPIKFSDKGLAGRLSEQAIKLAALIAISDQRLMITKLDLVMAYAIRQNIYARARTMLNTSGVLTDEHVTTKAVTQIRVVLERFEFISNARLKDYSKEYAKLSIRDQRDVIKSLFEQGAMKESGRKGRFESLLYASQMD